MIQNLNKHLLGGGKGYEVSIFGNGFKVEKTCAQLLILYINVYIGIKPKTEPFW